MLAKIISALAVTLLLTGSALAFIPQPQESLQTELVAAEPAQPEQSLQALASEPAQPEQGLQTELFASEPHDIYAGHSNAGRFADSVVCGGHHAIRAAPV